jgi:hypothetical protein
LASSGCRRESIGARLSDKFRQNENSRVPHLPQSLNQGQGFAGGDFGKQQALAFQNQIRMRPSLGMGVVDSAHQARLMLSCALRCAANLRSLIFLRRKEGQNRAA